MERLSRNMAMGTTTNQAEYNLPRKAKSLRANKRVVVFRRLSSGLVVAHDFGQTTRLSQSQSRKQWG